MGELNVNKISDKNQRQAFSKFLISDIHAMELMHHENMFENGVSRIGAEQELVLVGKDYRPSLKAIEILNRIKDEHYTTELALFNLEINLDPQHFSGSCFSKMEKQLLGLLNKGRKAAAKEDTFLLTTGILPTIQFKELIFENLTPDIRYRQLNDIIREQRGADFELNITGLDELVTKSENILFEACNTSFQIHLQVSAFQFQQLYNWSQAIAGPVLAITANSPILMGKRLWKETRIALFQQSIDTRNATHIKRDSEPRVSFGRDWLRGNVSELFKDNVSRFNMWFSSENLQNSLDVLNNGKIPDLKALRMHNGTVYKWNRPCYGISGSGKPHLRIENRYIPSGPTVIDEMANAAFWLGLMHGMPEEMANIHDNLRFDEVRFNFYNAARNGMEANFHWFGKRYTATELIKKIFLPIAYQGLEKAKVNKQDIDKYLSVIEGRLQKDSTGASWTTKNFTQLLDSSSAGEAAIGITKHLIENSEAEIPVHKWKNISPSKKPKQVLKEVYQIMETDLVTAKEDDLLEFLINMMEWRKIRHVPIENEKHELVGIVTSRCLVKYFRSPHKNKLNAVADIMQTKVFTADAHTPIIDAIRIMGENKIGCLPIIADNKLVGIITERDILKFAGVQNNVW